ncbi:M10 family metallopeptidase C-terminal domain-containing protein [Pseudomonas fluvialis]|uniref:M10 family metallopeptidase C-terminal domain-containing protein n=1 Tax=Pseudomonas fluvialis TaxID=1793966 RepID=UPI0035AE4DCB
MPSPYQGTATRVSPLSNDNLINSLLTTERWDKTALTFSFLTLGRSFYSNNYSYDDEYSNAFALSKAQMSAVRQALNSWSAVSQLTFKEVRDSSSVAGDLRFGGFSGMPDSYAAWAYYPSTAPVGGDVWIGQVTNDPAPTPGSYDFHTFVHEIGHALGLKHPFESEAGNPAVLPSALDDARYSVMSYNSDYDFLPTGPMLLDIAAIQHMYGANNQWKTGNDTYRWGASQQIFETLWDAGGIDTIDASNQLRAVRIDLNPGAFSRIGANIYDYQRGENVNDLLSIAYNVIIERAIGSAYDDELIGNNADNLLNGRAGNDTLRGGLGNDSYVIDSINDRVIELDGQGYDSVRININQRDGQYRLPDYVEEGQLINSVDFTLLGNALNNTLLGNARNNRLDGGSGADTMKGGAGNDTYVVDHAGDLIIDSAGLDSVESYISFTLGQGLENLVLLGHSAISGIGNNAANFIDGSQNTAGNLLIGLGGNDTYLLGSGDRIQEASNAGRDKAQSYFDITLDEHVEDLQLLGGANTQGIGNNLANTLLGNTGNNLLDGRAGVDKLYGGQGNDTYLVDLNSRNALEDKVIEKAGEGIDTIFLRGGQSLSKATSISLASHVEHLNASQTGSTLLNLKGNVSDNWLIGNSANNLIDGGAGNDLLSGNGGYDTLIGGKGADIFHFDLSWLNSSAGALSSQVNDFRRSDGDKLNFAGAAFTFTGNQFSASAGTYQLSFADGLLRGSNDHGQSELFQIRLLGVSQLYSDDFLAA